MTDALRLEVKKDQWRQNQGGDYKLTFTVNPTDLDDNAQDLLMDFFKAPMGAVYMLGAARVDVDTGEPARPQPAATETPEKPKVPFHKKPLSVQAGIRCQDERFVEYMRYRYPTAMQDADIVEVVRSACEVNSRKELDNVNDLLARQRWQVLNAGFEKWAGLVPEER